MSAIKYNRVFYDQLCELWKEKMINRVLNQVKPALMKGLFKISDPEPEPEEESKDPLLWYPRYKASRGRMALEKRLLKKVG